MGFNSAFKGLNGEPDNCGKLYIRSTLHNGYWVLLLALNYMLGRYKKEL